MLPLKLLADLYDDSVCIYSHFSTVSIMRGGIVADQPGLGMAGTSM